MCPTALGSDEAEFGLRYVASKLSIVLTEAVRRCDFRLLRNGAELEYFNIQ